MQPQKLLTRPIMQLKSISMLRKQLQIWLISPSKNVVDPGERIHAELIATSTLFFALLTIAGAVAASLNLRDIHALAPLLLKILSIVTLAGYLLSRTRYFHLSGLLIMSIWTIAGLGYVYSGGTTAGPAFAAFTLMPFGFILGYVLLQTQALIIVVFINIVGILLLPIFQPGIPHVIFGATSGTLFAMGGLTLIAQRHRDRLEEERLKAAAGANRELALIGNVRSVMARELELPDLFRSVVEAVAESFGYTQVSLYMLKGDALVLQHQVGYHSVISRIPVTEGVSGRVVRSGVPILLGDVQNDPEFLGAIEEIVSEICVPLKDEERVVGTLNVESTRGVRLTETDLKILTVLAGHVEIAIGRARLYNDIHRHNLILSALEKSTLVLMKELRLNDVLQTILAQAAQLLNTTHGYIYLVEPDETAIKVAVALGVFSKYIGYTLGPDEGMAGKVWQSGRPFNIPDYHRWDTRSRQFDESEFHAVVGVPLKSGEQVIGVLGLAHLQPGFTYNDTDLDLLKRFAQLASIAFDNARLHTLSQQELMERKRMQNEREQLIAELSARNNEMERFTYTVSHDLKSPLVTINGFLGYLERDAASGNLERLNRDIQRIRDAVQKMQKLLNELLELSRIGRIMNEPEIIAFEGLVDEALEMVHGRLAERGVIVHTHPNLPVVHGDKPRLVEVLQNLLDNAAKYMGSQGNPRVEIGQRGELDAMPVFFVQDNGMGIAPEHHERIFGLFNKLDANSEGTGVGLALVKRIIEVHGGQVWVESEAGRGSTFFFTLPSKPKSDSVI